MGMLYKVKQSRPDSPVDEQMNLEDQSSVKSSNRLAVSIYHIHDIMFKCCSSFET